MKVLWSKCPFILAVGSALASETGPEHDRTASCHPRGPVTSDPWQLFLLHRETQGILTINASFSLQLPGCHTSFLGFGLPSPPVLLHGWL